MCLWGYLLFLLEYQNASGRRERSFRIVIWVRPRIPTSPFL